MVPIIGSIVASIAAPVIGKLVEGVVKKASGNGQSPGALDALSSALAGISQQAASPAGVVAPFALPFSLQSVPSQVVNDPVSHVRDYAQSRLEKL